MVANKVPVLGCDVTVHRPEGSFYLHRVCGVVEINDVDIKDEDS